MSQHTHERSEPDQRELALLIAQGEGAIDQLGQAHGAMLGAAERWELDQHTGLISWTFPDRVASAPAQILGTHDPVGRTWLWAWANESVLPAMSRAARAVHDWALDRGHTDLTRPELVADEREALRLVALSVRLTEANGLYRDAGSPVIPYITFGEVTIAPR